MNAAFLDQTLRAQGVPIIGVSIGDPNDRSTWRVQFADTATQADRDTAAAIIKTFDASTPSTAQPPTPAITKLAFLKLLQPDEYARFVAAVQAGTDATLVYAQGLLQAAPVLHVDDPVFTAMITEIVKVGIVTQARADAIVAAARGVAIADPTAAQARSL